MTKRIHIGHFARIPLHVARAPVSEMAKSLWRELAFVSSPEKPAVWVRQQNFADKLNCCTRTIRRLIKELLEAKLIQKLPGKYQGRYVRYALNWVQQIFEKAVEKVEKSIQQIKTFVSRDSRHENGVIASEGEAIQTKILDGHVTAVTCHDEKNPPATSRTRMGVDKGGQELIEKFGENWQKIFPCLDGKLGRPSLKECIEQGLNHTSRKKYTDLKIYLEGWLRNASIRWLNHFQQNPPPPDVNSLRAYEEKRKQIEKKWFLRN